MDDHVMLPARSDTVHVNAGPCSELRSAGVLLDGIGALLRTHTALIHRPIAIVIRLVT
jgi:hypothetical protein